MKLQIKAGQTSQRIALWIADSSSTTGAGLTGLTNASAGLKAYYWRESDGNVAGTAIALVAGTRGTFASGGFVEKDSANMPGWYELGIPDAALAAGAKWVTVHLMGAANMAPLPLEIELVAYDPQDAAKLGLTNLDATVSSRLAGASAPTNFTLLAIDANGRVDLSKWVGAAVNALIAGRVDANAGVVGDKTGYALTVAEEQAIATALLDLANAIETGLTVRGALRLALAALAGKVSGAGTGTEVFREAVADAKARITATVDANGNRTALTTDTT